MKSRNIVVSAVIGVVIGILIVLTVILFTRMIKGNNKKLNPMEVTYEIVSDEVVITGLTDWGNELINIEIPDTIENLPVTEIADNAFDSKTKIENITLPEGLKRIGNRSFYNCCNLSSLKLPNSLVYVGSECFAGIGAQTITFPRNMVSIGINACLGIKKVYYYEGMVNGEPWGASEVEILTD